jgi:hypothetical protein
MKHKILFLCLNELDKYRTQLYVYPIDLQS